MILSQTAIYALKALVYLAERDQEDAARVDDIAAALGVPRNYLSKILHGLARAGILSSSRGPHGGFRLRVKASKLTLQQVIEPFDQVGGNSSCLLGQKRCSDTTPCAAHASWKEASLAVKKFFHETTVQDLSKRGTGILEGAD